MSEASIPCAEITRGGEGSGIRSIRYFCFKRAAGHAPPTPNRDGINGGGDSLRASRPASPFTSMSLLKRTHGATAITPRGSRLRLCVGAALAASMILRPVRLSSIQWWLLPDVASSIELTAAQRHTIEGLYGQRLEDRRRSVERLVAAAYQVDQLLRDGSGTEDSLRQTEALAVAADEHRALTHSLSGEIAAVLSEPQRQRLRPLIAGDLVE